MVDIRPMAARGFDMWSPQIITTTVSGGGMFGKGSIELETGWQLVAIPIEHGYWSSATHMHIHDGVTKAKFKNYVLDQISDLYGEDIVEVANTYTGDQQAFFSFVVGSTPASSPHNFNLVYSDNISMEIAGFWINIIGNTGPYVISWGE